MVISFQSIKNIKFPVFIIPSSNWELADGLLFIDGELVDDRNMPGESLGIRRMQTPHANLLGIRKAIVDVNGILKQKRKTFIDSNGKPFIYEKTLSCKLKYYRILQVELKESACLLRLRGVKKPFIVPRPPLEGTLWAGVLHYHGLPWMLYEYSEKKLADTRRKV